METEVTPVMEMKMEWIPNWSVLPVHHAFQHILSFSLRCSSLLQTLDPFPTALQALHASSHGVVL